MLDSPWARQVGMHRFGAFLGHDGRASFLCLPTLLRDLFLVVRPYRATEGAHEIGIWQSRSHGQRMAPGITHGKIIPWP
jgi:hypothetical protein